MIFVCGICNAKKKQYCDQLSRELGIKHFSANDLTSKKRHAIFHGQYIKNIKIYQDILFNEVNAIKYHDTDFILEGNLCFLSENGTFKLLDTEIINALKIDLLIVFISESHIAVKNSEKRYPLTCDEKLITLFQETELQYTRQLGQDINLDYKIVFDKERGNTFGQSILLPIHPTYVDKILNGEKRYEFRKKLCLKNIDKIYLYATSPIKKVLGETEVLEKCFIEKNTLWNLTYEYSGISSDFFQQYFRNQRKAGAYKLGKTFRYEKSMDLKTFGITYVPQSYAYINTIVRRLS